jgi:hypothetical protein
MVPIADDSQIIEMFKERCSITRILMRLHQKNATALGKAIPDAMLKVLDDLVVAKTAVALAPPCVNECIAKHEGWSYMGFSQGGSSSHFSALAVPLWRFFNLHNWAGLFSPALFCLSQLLQIRSFISHETIILCFTDVRPTQRPRKPLRL